LPRERASDGAPDGEETVLEIVRFIESEDTPDLWPGFRPSRIPLAFFDGDRTWLYGHPAPPETFRPHPAVDGLFRMDGRHSAMRGNTSTDVGGEETATILLPLLRDFPRVEDLAGVAIHEAFHVFQKERHPEWGPGGMGLDNPVTDERLLALRRTETTLLRQALGEADPERARARAVAALEVREERFSGLPPAIARFERGIELMEGTAQHVQVTATGSTAGLRDLPEEGFPAEALHMRSYAAGLAFTRLLERFRPNWEATVEARGDLPLDAVLAEATEGALAVDWTAVYAEELDEARRDVRRVQAARDSLRREFLERPGARLVLLAAEDAPLQLRGMDPMNLHMVGEGQVLHTRWLKLGHSTGSAEVLDGSALTFGVGGDPLGRGFHRVTVAGLEEEPTVRQEGREIVIRADGFQGRFRGAEVERVGEEIRIRLTPSPAPGEPSLSSSGFPCSGALPGPRAGGRSGRYARPGLRPPST
jgi:hypothetical protein